MCQDLLAGRREHELLKVGSGLCLVLALVQDPDRVCLEVVVRFGIVMDW